MGGEKGVFHTKKNSASSFSFSVNATANLIRNKNGGGKTINHNKNVSFQVNFSHFTTMII